MDILVITRFWFVVASCQFSMRPHQFVMFDLQWEGVRERLELNEHRLVLVVCEELVNVLPTSR